ncbi:hypothetical protein NJ7G_2692 [Natrinema sp. J7-2]|nr:hypothetical protein NJ7G_2692 [Natrinema sp. J7-2]
MKRRLPVLEDHGLLRKVDEDRGYYRITERVVPISMGN